jgi:hypothetical protein
VWFVPQSHHDWWYAKGFAKGLQFLDLLTIDNPVAAHLEAERIDAIVSAADVKASLNQAASPVSAAYYKGIYDGINVTEEDVRELQDYEPELLLDVGQTRKKQSLLTTARQRVKNHTSNKHRTPTTSRPTRTIPNVRTSSAMNLKKFDIESG